MKRRVLGLALLGLAVGCGPGAVSTPVRKPNLVILLVDDLGRGDLGIHGGSARTPHIDRLARESLRLTRFYVRPVCTPTRAGLLTGRYPHRFGLGDDLIGPNSRDGLDLAEQTLPEMLASVGYARRAYLGKWHLGHASRRYHPMSRGFTGFYGHYNGAIDHFTHMRQGRLDWHRDFDLSRDEGYATNLMGAEAVRFIRAAPASEPFLLFVAFNAPHSPLQAPRVNLDAYGYHEEAGPFQEASSDRSERRGRGNTVLQTYHAMISALDTSIGAILAALDQKGMTRDSLVWFLSDNGANPRFGGSNEPLRGGKLSLWEGGVRVPAFIRWPAAGLSGGREVDALAGYIDVVPTLLGAVGADAKPRNPLDGRNLLDVLTGTAQAPDRALYLGGDALVTQHWKLLNGRLYRIDRDPTEARDVAAAHPEVVERLGRQLAAFKALAGPAKSVPNASVDPGTRDSWKIPAR